MITARGFVPVMMNARLKAFPKNPTGGVVEYQPLSDALRSKYQSDVHIAAYSVPSVPRRLSRKAVSTIDGGVPMVAVLFDIDGHDADDIDAWFEAERPKIDKLLAAHRDGYVYRTRGGYRVVYQLGAPVVILDDTDAAAWSALYGAWVSYIERTFSIVADGACKDWQRLYRVPRATRDEGGTPEDREIVSDPDTIGAWGNYHLTAADLAADVKPKKSTSARGRLVEAFRNRGWLGSEIETGKHAVRCPWESEHSMGSTMDTSTVLYEPDADNTLGYLHCSHASCSKRTVDEVLALFTAEELGNGEAPTRALRSHSYLTAVTIVEQNLKDVVGGKLMLNEMSDVISLGSRPLTDVDFTRVRGEIERRFEGGKDKLGNRLGICLSLEDVRNAMVQVATLNGYNPVRDYLNGLTWDGTPRLDSVAETLFGAEDTQLNRTLIRRWFISGVARPFKPGAKVDSVLIFVGKQGAGKSTAFRVLAGDDLFTDSTIVIGSKDAFMTLRRCWILEWGELDSLSRARDAEAAKAFITSAVDTYRPPYGHVDVVVPRTGIIVGSTNKDEFLTDETGNRRFWPITVGRIDLQGLAAQRDQLWAEAVVAFRAGEHWWLDNAEEAALGLVHADHVLSDPWEQPVLAWTSSRLAEGFSAAEVLAGALEKPAGQWTKGDEMRLAKLLRQLGFSNRKIHGGIKRWFR